MFSCFAELLNQMKVLMFLQRSLFWRKHGRLVHDIIFVNSSGLVFQAIKRLYSWWFDITINIICQVNESLFPCELSKENFNLAEEAVELAVKTWGQSSLTELEAEERLSYSCEKVNYKKDIDHSFAYNYPRMSDGIGIFTCCDSCIVHDFGCLQNQCMHIEL